MRPYRWLLPLLFVGLAAHAQNQGPPAKVVVAETAEGRLAQTSEFKGTVYFKEVSAIATEVNGKVLSVRFEEGDRIDQGTVLVELDHSFLDAELRAARAAMEENETRLEQEQVRMARAETLLKDEVTTQQAFDDIRFTVDSLAHRVASNAAAVERIEDEIAKKTIVAPFSGIVIERMTEVGEWKSIGDTVAVFALASVYDVIVPVPEMHVPFVRQQGSASLRVRDTHLEGDIVAIIPRANSVHLTFPVKIRVEDSAQMLMEGMTAMVDLPVGDTVDCISVPRDAVLLEGGQNVIYVVADGTARRIPVDVVGYDGMTAGIQSEDVTAGMQVIVKGNERIRDGQPVEILDGSGR